MTQQELEAEVLRLREEMDMMLRAFWGVRERAKGEYTRIEKELEKAFKDMLERSKIETEKGLQ